jgi:glycosyltransferase involved in cell wall biosynthesis
VGLVAPFGVDGAVYVLDKMLSDETLYRRCRANALEFAKTHKWEDEARKYLKIYQELIDE